MCVSSSHNAPGQMAGYLFQPERALLWLAKSQRGAKIGIETIDDIAVLAPDGTVIREQDKHSILKKGNPLRDNSRALWNTLNIWLEAIKDKEIDIDRTVLFLVTNKTLPDCLAKRIGEGTEKDEISSCVKELRTLGANCPEGIIKIVKSVLSYDDSTLENLFLKITVNDETDASYGDSLYQEIASYLHIPDNLNISEIIQALLGWVHDTCLILWRRGEPAWLSREAFDNQYTRIISKYQKNTFVEKAVRMLPIKDSDRNSKIGETFVKQLSLISVSETEVFEAIDDFIRFLSEQIRLSREGDVTKKDFDAFKDRLESRWKSISNREIRFKKKSLENGLDLEDIGYDIYFNCMDHRESLAGQQTEEYYLTRGAYHELANIPLIGWHLDYKQLLNIDKKEE